MTDRSDAEAAGTAPHPDPTHPTRRAVVKAVGAGGAGLLIGGRGAMAGALVPASGPGPAEGSRAISHNGTRQPGVTTAPQRSLAMAAFDLSATTRADLVDLLRTWQQAIEQVTAGRPVGGSVSAALAPVDTGEAVGRGADRLTVTIGFGPSLFDGRFGLGPRRPPALVTLPGFPGDELDAERSDGDLSVQACAESRTVAEHAVRILARVGHGGVRLRWLQAGFNEPPPASVPRNLLGFKEGTSNLSTADEARMRRNVWAGADGAPWMANGTYQVYRRVRVAMRAWDTSPLGEQESVIGRTKTVGAPLGGRREFDPVVTSRLPSTSHIRVANPRTGPASEDERILRRAYNYHDGYDDELGDFDAGLAFIAYQRDPRRQFIPMQRRLAAKDALRDYLTHTASGLFAVPPGAARGSFVGAALFA